MNPDQYTIAEHFLEVGNGHSLYVQDWGNVAADLPILFLHGGPGDGINDRHKQRFTPKQQRVIFFDQRGSGKSTPAGSLEHNTTTDAVEDIEKIAKHLKVNKFIVTGGSWGSTLALAYALKYPKRVHALVLSGIYTARKAETEYLDNGGWRTHFPDVWDTYLSRTPKSWHHNPSAYHIQHALGNDPQKAKSSAYAYVELESALISLDDRHMPSNYDEFDPNSTRVELHYLAHGCFLPDGYIIKHAKKLKMPIWLVQGRYDMVCPPMTAWDLHQQLPNSHLIWTTAGHANDRANYDAIRTLLLQLTA